MVVEKLCLIKRSNELVAFSAKLDDSLPHWNSGDRNQIDKIYRESDGRMFFIKYVHLFKEPTECQDPIIIVIGDVDRYLKEGDNVTLIADSHFESENNSDRHYIPGGWWEQVYGKQSTNYCPICGKDRNK